MVFSTRVKKNVVIFNIKGNIMLGKGDEKIGMEIRRLLEKEGKKYFILNLAKVPFIDAGGRGAIIRSYSLLRQVKGRIVFLNPTNDVAKLLEMTRMNLVFETYTDEGVAISSFERP